MGILYTVIVPLLVFLTLIFLCSTILKILFSKFKNIPLRFRLTVLMGLSHFILVTVPCFALIIQDKVEPEAIMGFLFYAVIDFIFWPFYIWLLNVLIPILSLKISNIIAPLVAFGIFGSLFYCCLGWITGALIEKRKTNKKK